MTIVFAYDGSESADGAIAVAGTLFFGRREPAVIVTVWEPLIVEGLRASRFGWAAIPSDVREVDEQTATQAKTVAEHGASLASQAGFAARALWIADQRRIADTIVGTADELDADLIILGARGLSGIAAFLGSVSNHVVQHTDRPVMVIPLQARAGADESA